MPKLFSSREIISILEKEGFVFVSQKGSHGKFEHTTFKNIIIVPMNKRQIPQGTLSSIIRQSGLRRNNFGL